jgi:glyoxylase-like metal-dependent hydrolase (beta-lactamase superfamily II)
MVQSFFEIEVIKPGILVRDRFGNILDARSTVTLIMGHEISAIVDTGLPEEKEIIIQALAKLNLKPNDINVLINTHSHLDHCGNNELFKNAVFYGHKSEFGFLSLEKKHNLIENKFVIEPGILIENTPGHTRGSISIFITGRINNMYKNCAITGDALPIMDNYLKWVPPGINFDPGRALQSMNEIVQKANLIIPGHDKPFEIIDQTKRISKYL